MFPAIMRDLHLGYGDLGAITGVLSIAWGISALLTGRLADRFGRRMVVLTSVIVFSLLVCIPILKVLTTRAADSDTPMAPVRAEMSQTDRDQKSLPPEPRLQGVPGHQDDAQQDLRDKIAADTEANQSSGWVDKANGIAKIPVTEAMKIIAEKSGNELGAAGKRAGEKK